MSGLVCKHCGSGSFVRNGMAHGHQRYRCKVCGRSFTATPPRGKPPAMKALAVLLYALGNVSQGMIGKLLGVSHVAVYKWVRAAGEGTPAPSATPARGKPAAMKALAVLLYALGNVSQGMIAKLLGVSHVAVYKWVRAAGETASEPSAMPTDAIVQIDEMWHFVNGKKQGLALAGL